MTDDVMFSLYLALCRRDATATESWQCRVQANTPTAWYWLRFVVDDGGRQDHADGVTCKECRGGVCHTPLPCRWSPGVNAQTASESD